MVWLRSSFIKGLLTECEVWTGKHLPEVFVSKYYLEQTEQTRVLRLLLNAIFFSVFSAVFVFRCCRLPYLWACWFRFMFTSVRHSFASLIDKQLSRQATLLFQDVLLFELFQWTYIILFLFSFESTLTFSRPNLSGSKKSVLPSHSAGRTCAFSDPSATN